MRSVDDAIAGLLRSLRETEQIDNTYDNTYIVLWNDNGYHMGQHRNWRARGPFTRRTYATRWSCAGLAWRKTRKTRGW